MFSSKKGSEPLILTLNYFLLPQSFLVYSLKIHGGPTMLRDIDLETGSTAPALSSRNSGKSMAVESVSLG